MFVDNNCCTLVLKDLKGKCKIRQYDGPILIVNLKMRCSHVGHEHLIGRPLWWHMQIGLETIWVWGPAKP